MRGLQINSVNTCQTYKSYVKRKSTTGIHQRNNIKKNQEEEKQKKAQ